MGLGQMSPACGPACGPFVWNALEQRVPPSCVQKRPPSFCLLNKKTSNKAWQLLGEGHAHFRGTKEPAMQSAR